jgi:hypothetical protein
MNLLTSITFDQVLVSLMSCIAIREMMIIFLPDRIAGPDGWLIRTGGAGETRANGDKR